jgi:cobalt-precorrin-6B (C15)-methyltransferase
MEWQYSGIGIPEKEFITGDVPITKTEIRVLTLSKLQIFDTAVCLDIGCGTGSVTVEMALQCGKGRVVAIDKDDEAVSLTKQNINKFRINNTEVIVGGAPENLPDKKFNRIFLGGGSKEIEKITTYAYAHLSKDGIFVVNTILLDSTYEALKMMEKLGFKNIECICANISRGQRVSGWMMKALNPIYIISGCKLI